MKKFFVAIVSIIFTFSAFGTIVSAEESGVQLVDTAKSAMLIERDTGQVLFEKNGNEKLPPASMTKIMTMLLIMEAIDKGELTWDEKIRTSEHAASMGGSQIFLEPGEEMTTDEMVRGIAIASGNDASVAMAERIAGSEEAFVQLMNDKVKELGLKDTKFQNPTGLPAKEHYSTAYDMAIIAKELLKYEDITKYTGKYEDYLRENTDKKFWLVNTNRLVKFYPGVDGLKTGFTQEAKYCLTATAKKDDMRVIAVVFGAPTPKDRNAQISKMLDFAFTQYKTHPMFDRNEAVAKVKVSKGSKKEIDAVTSEPISMLTKKSETVDDVIQEIKINEKIQAPVKKGDPVGTITLKKGDEIVSESELVAGEDSPAASWWKLFKRTMGQFTKVND
ncbi:MULTISPECIES: D-alanyl-D-alanine carboxypeptidase family protein [Sutcliffiella]|uniref:serine-type D-Ala-D-Ala carboxypeptidase n=1 Tax=Sutcliffiella cohnii TaxID=33932 RepID=A0A223KS51_9BACI|nr:MULTISPECIES: D-alanyl-D-alanine carboxypeptidase family protein [Sutcliffiella]AST92322.1 D-alanyl-D-alanine carboxypeptidase [Sutcliffiella cohnii]MED4017216.1 D-alanyl-D-alanine carboxypeptidase [Sutcliffiella cohnii]WBL13553.1 D-alanyl-D-alanine carboxypeptidase [Sutcliffiella sp. NC1]